MLSKNNRNTAHRKKDVFLHDYMITITYYLYKTNILMESWRNNHVESKIGNITGLKWICVSFYWLTYISDSYYFSLLFSFINWF